MRSLFIVKCCEFLMMLPLVTRLLNTGLDGMI
jgi:hypothetical protein